MPTRESPTGDSSSTSTASNQQSGIPATYWNGQPVHAPSTHSQGSLGRSVGLFVDHYLPGDYYADHILNINKPIPGTTGNTASDEVAVIAFWLLVVGWVAWVTWGTYEDE